MIGAIGIAKPGQTVRCDLDNELEGGKPSLSATQLQLMCRRLLDAKWFTREQVMEVLNSAKTHQISRADIERMDGNRSPERPKSPNQGDVLFKMPPA